MGPDLALWPEIIRQPKGCMSLLPIFDQNASQTPNMNTLPGLPVEILLSITDFLPINDWICLSLCNHRLFAIYNHRYKSMWPTREMKLTILRQLQQDLPRHFICYQCYLLHLYDGSESFGLSGPNFWEGCPLRCRHIKVKNFFELELVTKFGYLDYMPRRFSFLHLQLAMRRFYLGDKFGITTESLAYTQVRFHPSKGSWPGVTYLFSTDARIRPEPPGLHIRTQWVIFSDFGEPELLLKRERYESDTYPRNGMYICEHVPNWQKERQLDAMVKAFFQGKHPSHSKHTCERCNTDYQIELCDHVNQVALVLTTWFNLGPGLTPDDPRWRVRDGTFEDITLNPSDCKESPRAFFETNSPQPVEKLLSTNLCYLQNQRYRKVMRDLSTHDHYKSLWCLPSLPSDSQWEFHC
ncbi:unnamed protein product [Penicillium salamii]|uniref:F-box domain-containing protein n=1 Tax=Penicillium salamii TaxID=1612424 RepID=A0A9W4JJ70_9EURO|nr:unnamed protein product [Penicillium salamii]CAG7941718.1 unnamed protein product [Penicillium salamii]CAG7954455.1 unnamed protein product [Penicillium salamii]CAG8120523.1 unnamed protein product [Penicillium salamii]CAG8155472.1 unnamed protein product [Penicillium salamii]